MSLLSEYPATKPSVDFFVVGAPKCGTSSLFDYLRISKEIFLPSSKELHYFSQPEVFNSYYNLRSIPKTLDKYHENFSLANDSQLCGDISPSYLSSIGCAKAIFDYNPNSKIIIMLRDPVDRAVSHYLMDKRFGLVDVSLLEILKNPFDYPLYYREYVHNGKYYSHIKNYLEYFSPSEVLVTDFELLRTNPSDLLAAVLNFLGIEKFLVNTDRPRNSYTEYRFDAVRVLRKLPWLQYIVSEIPFKYKQWVIDTLLATKADKPKLQEERVLLNDIFSGDLEQVETLVSRLGLSAKQLKSEF